MIRLIGSVLIEQNDEWLLTRGYLSKESIALVLEDQGDADGSEVTALGDEEVPASPLHHNSRLD